METRTKIAVVLIALIVTVGLGSAAVVTYLSNTVENDVEVTSPLAITEFEMGDIVAGNVTCLNVSVLNNANRNICGYFEVAVTAGGVPFDCDGLTMEGMMTSCEGAGGDLPCIPSFCDAERGVFVFPACLCYTAGEIEEFDAKIYADPTLAPGNYELDTIIRTCDTEGWNDGEGCECDEEDEDMMCGGICTEDCICGYIGPGNHPGPGGGCGV